MADETTTEQIAEIRARLADTFHGADGTLVGRPFAAMMTSLRADVLALLAAVERLTAEAAALRADAARVDWLAVFAEWVVPLRGGQFTVLGWPSEAAPTFATYRDAVDAAMRLERESTMRRALAPVLTDEYRGAPADAGGEGAG